MQDRRKFLASVGTVGSIAIAGCSGSSEPDLTVRNLRHTQPRLLGTSSEEVGDMYEFSAEIRNTGSSGPVLVRLFWGEENTSSPAWEGTTHFNSNETREISTLEEPPSFTDSYTFQARGLGYSGDIRNNGGAGSVDVRLIDGSTESIIKERTINLEEEETRTVQFETEHEFTEDYVIEAEAI